jgi:hypothetical protein
VAVKFTNNAQAALQQPDTRTREFEMTPEKVAKFSRVTGLVVDVLKQNSESPIEAYMMLQFIQHAFEDNYGIRGSIIMDKDDRKD